MLFGQFHMNDPGGGDVGRVGWTDVVGGFIRPSAWKTRGAIKRHLLRQEMELLTAMCAGMGFMKP